jgi:hypothetical protein
LIITVLQLQDRHPGDLSVIVLRRAVASWRVIRFVRASDDGLYPEADWDYAHQFRGRSVRRLRSELATLLNALDSDLIMCVRAGRYGRLTPLFVNLPRAHGDSRDNIEIVVIMDGTPGDNISLYTQLPTDPLLARNTCW